MTTRVFIREGRSPHGGDIVSLDMHCEAGRVSVFAPAGQVCARSMDAGATDARMIVQIDAEETVRLFLAPDTAAQVHAALGALLAAQAGEAA